MACTILATFAIASENTTNFTECGTCDGKITELTLKYEGSQDILVKATDKKDEPIFSDTISTNDHFTLSGFDKQGTLGSEIKLFINDHEHVRIHTSCSVPILSGMKFGQFTIVEGYSRNGGLLCQSEVEPEPVSAPTCGDCDGKINSLTLQSKLDKDALIEVYGHKDELAYRGTVSKYELFTVKGFDKKGTLGPKVNVYVDGILHTEIHTSCSVPLLTGMEFGSFTIRDGSSRNGGKICALTGSKTGTLCGRVYEDKNANQIKDSDENGTEGIQVQIIDSSQILTSVTTDISGEYCVEDILEGNATIEVKTSTLPEGTELFGGENPNSVEIIADILNDAGEDGYIYLKPEAFDQNITTLEDAPHSFALIGNDPSGKTLTYTLLSQPQHGILSGTAPNLTYTPNENYYGDDSFTFRVNNAMSDSNPATIIIEVTPVNDAPIASDDLAQTNEDIPVTLNVVLNDSDIDGPLDPATLQITQQPLYGTVQIDTNTGTVVYTPNIDYFGTDHFKYTIKDNEGLLSNEATVTIHVLSINDRPNASEQHLITPEDTAKEITLRGSDADGDLLTYEILTAPIYGTLSGNVPNLIYTPNENYNGNDSFTFRINDGAVNSDTATISLEITPVNDAPVAKDDAISIDEDTSTVIAILSNDYDIDSHLDITSLQIVTKPTYGEVSVNPQTGEVSYTPLLNYHGEDSFAYTVKDNEGLLSNTGEVSISIQSVNDVPVALVPNVSLEEDTPYAIVLGGRDDDNDTLTYLVVSTPGHGSLTGTAPNLTYAPNENYHGSDSFSFKVSDGTTDSEIVTVNMTIIPVNDAPVAFDDTASLDQGSSILIDVLLNDKDIDGTLEGSTISIGTASMHAATTLTNGKIEYTPQADYYGTDSFTYFVQDNEGALSNSATVSINVIRTNKKPIAYDQSLTTPEDTSLSVFLSGSDDDNDTISYHLTSHPAHGDLLGSPPNLTYKPQTGYFGQDTFTFKVNDGYDDSALATITINVNSDNTPPVAYNQSVTALMDTPANVILYGKDLDGDALSYTILTGPKHGQLNGSAPNLTYTPPPGYTGSDCFSFKANDGMQDSNEAVITIDTIAQDASSSGNVTSNMEELSVYLHTDEKTYTQRILGENIGGNFDQIGIAYTLQSTLDRRGLGIITITLFNTGQDDLNELKIFFMADIAIDEETNTFFNEYGKPVDVNGSGESDPLADYWQIDEPDYLSGRLIENLKQGRLDQTSHVSINNPDDTAMALGFDIDSIEAGRSKSFILKFSSNDIGGLKQIDKENDAAIYYNATLQDNIAATCVQE